MARKISIVCLPGDGVGPEVVGEAVKVLKLVAAKRSQALNVEFELKNELIGLAAMEKTGTQRTNPLLGSVRLTPRENKKASPCPIPLSRHAKQPTRFCWVPSVVFRARRLAADRVRSKVS